MFFVLSRVHKFIRAQYNRIENKPKLIQIPKTLNTWVYWHIFKAPKYCIVLAIYHQWIGLLKNFTIESRARFSNIFINTIIKVLDFAIYGLMFLSLTVSEIIYHMLYLTMLKRYWNVYGCVSVTLLVNLMFILFLDIQEMCMFQFQALGFRMKIVQPEHVSFSFPDRTQRLYAQSADLVGLVPYDNPLKLFSFIFENVPFKRVYLYFKNKHKRKLNDTQKIIDQGRTTL